MKKILFICDGDNFPKGAFRFIKMMNDADQVAVKGIFFTPIDFEQLISVSYIPMAEPYVKLKEEERRLVKKSKDQFIEQCEASRIKYHILDKNEDWDKDVFTKESRFADLVIISEELFCYNNYTEQPNFFMQEALHGTECPIVVVPETFKDVEHLAFAYDGKKESVFALKQFTYLFPQFVDLPAEFVYMRDEEKDDIPDLNLLEEYTRFHFNCMAASKLHFDPKKYFSTWIKNKKNALLVSGSYGRSIVSNILRRSFADKIIHDHANPVFIAH